MPDIIVRPGTTEEVSKVMKIANYYKIPVTIMGRRLRKSGRRSARGRRHSCWTSSVMNQLIELNDRGRPLRHLPRPA